MSSLDVVVDHSGTMERRVMREDGLSKRSGFEASVSTRSPSGSKTPVDGTSSKAVSTIEVGTMQRERKTDHSLVALTPPFHP